eukprot:3353029-Rhodomonas_salina.1
MRRRRPRCRWCGAAGWARAYNAFRCTHSTARIPQSKQSIPPHAFRRTRSAARIPLHASN